MSTTTKNIEVLIPDSIQNRIDEGDYKIIGTQVRDNKGRIVCNLDSLDSGEKQYFSPHIFQSFEGCTFISCSIVSHQLQKELRECQSRIDDLDLKIDKVIVRQTNELVSAISDFDEHFHSLMEGSSLTSEKETFQSGVRAASLLASNIGSYLDDFKASTIVFHSDSSYKGEVYSQYVNRDKYKPSVTKRVSPKFRSHQSNYFVYSFLKILNNINILSVSYDEKTFGRYEDNLEALEGQLINILHFLMRAIGDEGDVYSMCYSTRGYNGTYYPLDIERVIRYDESNSIHELILRQYPKNIDLEYDENRISSIYDVIDILEEIENLKLRSEQVRDLKLSDLSEIADIKRAIFKSE